MVPQTKPRIYPEMIPLFPWGRIQLVDSLVHRGIAESTASGGILRPPYPYITTSHAICSLSYIYHSSSRNYTISTLLYNNLTLSTRQNIIYSNQYD